MNNQHASVKQLSRRRFLVRLGGAAAVITLTGAGVASKLDTSDRAAPTPAGTPVPQPTLPNAGDPVTPAPGTRPEYTPVEDHFRLDLGTVPEIDGEAWRLNVTGLVETPLALTLEDIRQNYDPIDFYITLACISNPIDGRLIGTTRWTGIPLQDILDAAGVQENATCLMITGADDFYESLALENLDEQVILAYAWDGAPLLPEHGYPLRLYIPDLYGMKLPKWITDIEVMEECEPGYWVVRRWDPTAQVKATSVIDTVAVDALLEEDDRVLVPIGGIAQAGARGISKVEVRVDQGEWEEAQLREPLSDLTWVIWRYDWPFQEGKHSFSVRCYDGDGTLQPTESASPYPSGATGIHTRYETL